jgi:hypothetical protein
MNQITDKDELLREWRRSIEWDPKLKKFRAEIPSSTGFSRTRLFDTMFELNQAYQAAVNPTEPTAIARPLPLFWVGCFTKWQAKIEVNGLPVLIGHFRTKPAAQAALDKFFKEKP